MRIIEVDEETKDFSVYMAEHFHGSLVDFTIDDAVSITGMPKKTVENILWLLVEMGFVKMNKKTFRLTRDFYTLYSYSGYKIYFVTPKNKCKIN